MIDEILQEFHFSREKRLERRAEVLGLNFGEIFNVRVWEEEEKCQS